MHYMREALKLAEIGKHSVSPNPMVGCVIEKHGKIVGTGYHQKTGFPHAEIVALQEAKEQAYGANMYVTLEPCCHHGRTPPCVAAIIAAKIKNVYVAILDPNPLVNGKGVRQLQEAGIEVNIGMLGEEAARQNEVFFHYHKNHLKPFIACKWAMTMDGNIACRSGKSKWISNAISRQRVHQDRAWLGAVLVGSGTILTDNPSLLPYLLIGEAITQPWRIILDSQGRVSLNSKIFDVASHKLCIATSVNSDIAWRQSLQDKGVTVLVLPEKKPHQIDLPILIEKLGQLGVTGLLVEGGQKILTSFFRENLLNRVHIYLAPKLVGTGLCPLDDLLIKDIDQALPLSIVKVEMLKHDILVVADVHWNN